MGLLTGCFPGLFEVLQFWNANNIENKKIKNRYFFILAIKLSCHKVIENKRVFEEVMQFMLKVMLYQLAWNRIPEILALKKGLIERPLL